MNFFLIIVIVLIIYCLFFSEDTKCYKIKNNVEDFSNESFSNTGQTSGDNRSLSIDNYRKIFDNAFDESKTLFKCKDSCKNSCREFGNAEDTIKECFGCGSDKACGPGKPEYGDTWQGIPTTRATTTAAAGAPAQAPAAAVTTAAPTKRA